MVDDVTCWWWQAVGISAKAATPAAATALGQICSGPTAPKAGSHPLTTALELGFYRGPHQGAIKPRLTV